MSGKENMEDHELAELGKKYENILSEDPKSNNFSLLANVLYRQGKTDKAIGVLIRGLGYNKNNVTARFLLGKIYYERWMINQAKKEMEKVLQYAPQNLEAAKLLSQIYRSEDKWDKALQTLSVAYSFHSSDENVVVEMKEIKKEISKNKAKLSKQVFETPSGSRKIKGMEIDDSSKNEEVYTETMANLYIEQGQYDKAREVLEKIFTNEAERNLAIEKLEETKLNKMNLTAGLSSRE
ncbi:MAG: tetratricopeptide repeat protein [Candidatus Dadabacteria bacterium]|nr:tetratricopeptide repeat protein [Candidatus Dadabacteria bacterium]